MTPSKTLSLNPKERLANWANDCRDICGEEGSSASVSDIEAAAERYSQEHFVFAIMGLAKRGKSTLVNALLGRTDDALAPVDKLPATSVATIFSWSESLSATVVLRDGSRSAISIDDIRGYVTEEGNPKNAKNVQLVEIKGPFADVFRNIMIVDLPGLGSLHEQHDQILRQYLPQSDALLLLTTARMPINQEEINLLNEAQKSDIAKLFVAINQVDRTESEELAQCEAHTADCLRKIDAPMRKIHKISALRALNGDQAGSGLANLVSDIRDFIQAERGELLGKRLVAEVTQASAPVLQGLAAKVSLAGKTTQEIAGERQRLTSERKSMEKGRQLREQTFLHNWDHAIHLAELALPAASMRVIAQLTNELDNTTIAKVGVLEKNLPNLLVKTMENELTPILTPMDSSLRDASREIEASYPCVEISTEGAARITSYDPHQVGAIKGAVGGGALVVGGIGVATAASSAVAAAAAAATITSVTAPGAALIATLVPGWASGIVTVLGTSSIATTAAPSAWLLAATPIGWTLAGIGAIAIPLAWGISRTRRKEDLRRNVEEQVRTIFTNLRNERLATVRAFGPKVMQEYRLNLDRRLQAIDDALENIAAKVGNVDAAKIDRQRFERLDALLANPPAFT